MTFDQYGYLTPYDIIPTDLETFQQVFVKDFEASVTRNPIFEAYLNYVGQLQKIVGTGFWQWVDGSFTTKKRNPKDIDFVTFVDFEIYQQHEKELSELRKLRHIEKRILDNYFVPTFDKNSLRFFEFEGDRLYWLHRFEKDDRNRTIHKKGILELNF